MRYLLDTHTLLWIITDDRQLSGKVRKLFLDEKNDIVISMASIWELAIKISLGKLEIRGHLPDFVKEHILGNNITILSIELPHLYNLETQPFYHRNPFDRLMISQSIFEKLPIISRNEALDNYPIRRIWS